MTRLPILAPLHPASVVSCARLHAALSAACCATRHVARYPSGRRKGAIRFRPCGDCEAGAMVLLRLELAGWSRPPDTLPAEVLDNVQRAARERWLRTFAAHREVAAAGEDPFRVVAEWTPDDRGRGSDLG